jgi:hypothetical protein
LFIITNFIINKDVRQGSKKMGILKNIQNCQKSKAIDTFKRAALPD